MTRRAHPQQRREAKLARRRRRLARGSGSGRAARHELDADIGAANLQALLFGRGKMRHRATRGARGVRS